MAAFGGAGSQRPCHLPVRWCTSFDVLQSAAAVAAGARMVSFDQAYLEEMLRRGSAGPGRVARLGCDRDGVLGRYIRVRAQAAIFRGCGGPGSLRARVISPISDTFTEDGSPPPAMQFTTMSRSVMTPFRRSSLPQMGSDPTSRSFIVRAASTSVSLSEASGGANDADIQERAHCRDAAASVRCRFRVTGLREPLGVAQCSQRNDWPPSAASAFGVWVCVPGIGLSYSVSQML
jgi:hypothetical protein